MSTVKPPTIWLDTIPGKTSHFVVSPLTRPPLNDSFARKSTQPVPFHQWISVNKRTAMNTTSIAIRFLLLASLITPVALAAGPVDSQESNGKLEDVLKSLQFRAIGPANM